MCTASDNAGGGLELRLGEAEAGGVPGIEAGGGLELRLGGAWKEAIPVTTYDVISRKTLMGAGGGGGFMHSAYCKQLEKCFTTCSF